MNFIYKYIRAIGIFFLGSIVISSIFGYLIGTYLLAGCLFLILIMKADIKKKDKLEFDFNSFILICIIIPAIIDFAIGYDIFNSYINEFFQKDFYNLDNNLKQFYITSLLNFFIFKYFIAKTIHKLHIGYIHLDYILLFIYTYNIIVKPFSMSLTTNKLRKLI